MLKKCTKKCYMHIGGMLGVFVGIFSGLLFKSVPLGICIVMGLMFGGAIGALIDEKKETALKN